LQATFTFVLRAFSTLEGIGKTLVPTYRFSEVAQPYATVRSTQSLLACA
jgi:predicted unusual protein kinase regulating ubiquinone biosynthesis (AarF/ABC1/UbiB family)